MAVKYSIVERGNPANPLQPKKFHPSIKASGRVTTRELVETASEMCPLTSSDQINNVLPRFLPGALFMWLLEKIRFTRN